MIMSITLGFTKFAQRSFQGCVRPLVSYLLIYLIIGSPSSSNCRPISIPSFSKPYFQGILGTCCFLDLQVSIGPQAFFFDLQTSKHFSWMYKRQDPAAGAFGLLYKRQILAAGAFFWIPAFLNPAAGAFFWTSKCRTLAAGVFFEFGVSGS